ncbi:MAG: NAD(P)H-dependent oxidoreductase [Gammaproteobacteria bacterium]
MNTKRILIIQGHPDIDEQHLCHQLAHSYHQAAESAGHQVQLLEIGKLDFPVLRSRKEWESSDVCADIQAAQRALKGKSTRIIVTMGMPGWFYYGVYMAHSLRSLVRNILSFTGFGPNRTTVFGLAEGMTEKRYQRYMEKVAALGRKGV